MCIRDSYNAGRKAAASHKVKISEKMGYKGDVEHTRIMLEKIFVTSPDTAGISTTV